MKKISSGILCTDITDHYPNFIILNTKKQNLKTRNKYHRPLTDSGKAIFKNKIQSINWLPVIENSDAQTSFAELNNLFLDAFNEAFPLKELKVKTRCDKPWLTNSLKKCIRDKNKLYIKYHKTQTVFNKNTYLNYKRALQNLLRTAEKLYYQNEFDKNINNLKSTWKTLKNLIGVKGQSLCNEFIINGRLESDSSKIANEFNKYFVNVGASLATQIPEVDGLNYKDFMHNQCSCSMFLEPTTPPEVIRVLATLKNSSPGWDGVKVSLIKEVQEFLVVPLTHVINLSFSQGVFPDDLKTARVVPIFKKGNMTDLGNYRPISIITSFAKIFERLMYIKLQSYLDKNDILFSNQFGFRPGSSTSFPLTLLVDQITEALDEKEYLLGMFLDLSKAFDTVDHKILLHKLEHYGIRGNIHKWFISYLANRKQFVEVNSVKSDVLGISHGVPQGSILGPLLFLLYINDLPNISESLYFLIFADDTNVFLRHKCKNRLQDQMNSEISKLALWMKINKLSLNINKSKAMLFTNKNEPNNLIIKIEDTNIEFVTQTMFLGVILDNKLKWENHIHYITNKIAKVAGVFNKIKYNIFKKTFISLYYALVNPYLTYCNIIWGSTFKTHLNKLVIVQKRVLRIMFNRKYRDHTEMLFRESRILNINQLYIYEVCCFMYRYCNNKLPSVFDSMFSRIYNVHSYQTRNNVNFVIPYCRTDLRKRSVLYNGPYYYNNLITYTCGSYSIGSFKKILRSTIIEKYC